MFHRIYPSIAWTALLAYVIISLFDIRAGLVAAVCMIAPVVFSFFRGRLWCGRFCPRGSFLELLPRKSLFARPLFMKSALFRTVFFMVLMSAFIIQIVMSNGSLAAIGTVLLRMVVITTILSVMLGVIFGKRTWCSVCPMGTVASLLSKTTYSQKRSSKVMFRSGTCASCNLCGKKCPMHIHPLSFIHKGTIDHPDCIKCNQCAKVCPSKNIGAA